MEDADRFRLLKKISHAASTRRPFHPLSAHRLQAPRIDVPPGKSRVVMTRYLIVPMVVFLLTVRPVSGRRQNC